MFQKNFIFTGIKSFEFEVFTEKLQKKWFEIFQLELNFVSLVTAARTQASKFSMRFVASLAASDIL